MPKILNVDQFTHKSASLTTEHILLCNTERLLDTIQQNVYCKT